MLVYRSIACSSASARRAPCAIARCAASSHGDSDHDEHEHDSDEPRLRSVSLAEGAYAVGKTLTDLALAELGVELTAIRRQNTQTPGAYWDNPL